MLVCSMPLPLSDILSGRCQDGGMGRFTIWWPWESSQNMSTRTR